MKSLMKIKTTNPRLVVLFALAAAAFCQIAQAVSPAPDGGYPGFNTAEGQSALSGLTTGVANTAIGWFSLKSDTDGSFNTGVGAGTLLLNIGDQSTGEGVENTAFGAAALLFNTTGSQNTANGTAALLSNTSGGGNTATGDSALHDNSTGFANTANGAFALFNNTTGISNTATGLEALSFNVSGNRNTATGVDALESNTADDNTAVGSQALQHNTIGANNTAAGTGALQSNTDGGGNVAIGEDALVNNVSGFHNIAVGTAAGFNIVTGHSNVYIGYGVSANGPFDESDTIRIADSAPPVSGTTSQVFVAGIFGATVGGANTPVIVNANGQLGTAGSSARFKKDIDPMGKISEAIFSLRPVTFHYKGDETNIPQFGLIAEEVAKVNAALILQDKEGKPYTVRYDQINAMLLNEFLKEHRTVEALKSKAADQDATVAELKSALAKQVATITQQQQNFQCKLAEQEKRIEALTSGLQKASAQMERAKPTTKVALD
ncbi:MAG TPA: tail fiber domain-containing protein [Candidatus Udaeobacter sp.]|nr:tail fiber domain-containing protein [Candidatus Udaeobacter sp.]